MDELQNSSLNEINCSSLISLSSLTDIPSDIIVYILSFIIYDPNIFLISKEINYMYHKSFFYGIYVNKMWIKFRIQKSDHNGYCSGNECDYSAENKTINVPIKQKFYSFFRNSKLSYLLNLFISSLV